MTSAPGFSETGTTWLGYRRATGPYRRVLIVMFLAGVATFAQLYAPQAVLPELSEYFGVPISSAALVVSAGTIGLAVTVLPWSIVADRIGRRKSIAIAVFVATVCALAISVAPSFELVLALRVLEGAALGGVPAAAIAYVNEEIHPIDAAVASGIFIAGNTIGGIAGRIITGPITEVTGSWRLRSIRGGGCLGCLCGAVYLVGAAREGLHSGERRRCEAVAAELPLCVFGFVAAPETTETLVAVCARISAHGRIRGDLQLSWSAPERSFHNCCRCG